MSVNAYNQEPYWDDYDPRKGFVQILAVAGKAEQSREFTQMGTMNRDFLARLGDAIFRNGTIIEGLSPFIEENKVTLSPGKVYYNGLVREVYEPVEVEIYGVGIELIGIKLQSSIVTADQDASLRNPAVGTEAHGLDGAHRIKEEIVITNNDPEATTLLKLDDGVLVSEVVYEEDTQDIITDTLARRTFDENGNFKISGLELQESMLQEDEDKVQVVMSAGKAYIKGYEVNKPYMTNIKLDRSEELRRVSGEPITFLENEMTKTPILEYALSEYPVKEITRMDAYVEKTVTVTRGTPIDGRDKLPDTNIEYIVSIQGYDQNVDYKLTANCVDWGVPGTGSQLPDEPAPGSSYTVTYVYRRNYDIVNEIELETQVISGEKRSVIKLKEDTVFPLKGRSFNVDYDFYLARKDRICIDKNGEIGILKGVSDKANLCLSPLNGDSSVLSIGVVLVLPNSYECEIVNDWTVRLTQFDLYNLKRRVDNLEESVAMTDLDREIRENEVATDLNGIYTDGFLSYAKCDLNYKEPGEDDFAFTAAIDTDTGELTLGIDEKDSELTVNFNKDSSTTCQVLGTVLMAPYTEEKMIINDKATDNMLVNPYAVYDPMIPVKLDPSDDSWVDTNYVTVNKEVTTTGNIRRWWHHRGEAWAEEERKRWNALGYSDSWLTSKEHQWISGVVGQEVKSSVSRTSKDELILYMREKSVKVTAHNLGAFTDNVQVFFNDKLISAKPATGYSAGATAGTLKANSMGVVCGTFTVPAKTPCGVAKVEVRSAKASGLGQYRAEGTKRTVTDTVLKTTKVLTAVDPLAQSFGFDKDQIITGIDLFFAQKDPNLACIVQIRDMVNGYPGTTCYAEQTVMPENIKVSSGKEATHISFENPVYCLAGTQYCICVLTDSNLYKLWIAELGKKDVNTGVYVTSQPYLTGVMFSSSNALTWTAHQTMDMKFNLYRAYFAGEGVIEFNKVTDLEMCELVMAADYIDYDNAGVEWWYKVGSSGTLGEWQPLDSYVERHLGDGVKREFLLRANIKSTFQTSPVIRLDTALLASFINKTNGKYISREITLEEPFSKVKVQLERALPPGCELKVEVMMSDISETWHSMGDPIPSRMKKVSAEFDRCVYEKSVSSFGIQRADGHGTCSEARNYRVKLTLTTVNPWERPRVRKLGSILGVSI